MSRPLTPLLAVDVIIELTDQAARPIVLIKRRFAPPGWALPGGFVDIGEPCEHAAVREAREETGLEITLTSLLGCYSDPRRDTRGHTASIVYVAQAHGTPVAADDAAEAGVFEPADCPLLAFDHDLIMQDYRRFRRSGLAAPIRL